MRQNERAFCSDKQKQGTSYIADVFELGELEPIAAASIGQRKNGVASVLALVSIRQKETERT